MRFTLFFALFVFAASAIAQEPQVAPDAPQDQPTAVSRARLQKLDEAIKPYVAQAQESYPAAKKSFQAGLPEGQVFFVTARIKDASGKIEQVFIAVESYEGDTIHGRIRSDVIGVSGYRKGDAYSLPESEILDWLITHPDGSEEGNFVGKFLDTYQPE